jgi:ferredoxin
LLNFFIPPHLRQTYHHTKLHLSADTFDPVPSSSLAAFTPSSLLFPHRRNIRFDRVEGTLATSRHFDKGYHLTPMPDKKNRLSENVSGKFYVDDQCIDCDACRATAPDNFARNDEKGYSFVLKQPTTELESQLCRDALEGCPVEAIGEDGDD